MPSTRSTNKLCSGCQTHISDQNYIVCTYENCKKIFHVLCLNSDQNLSFDKATWICPECKCKNKKGGDNSAASASSRHTSENETLHSKEDTGHRAPKYVPAENLNDIQVLTSEIRLFREEMSALKLQLTNVVSAISHCNERLDDITYQLTQSDSKIKYLEDRNLDHENTILMLQEQLNYQAQLQLRNEIEIVGIPEHSNENLCHIVLTTASKIGVSLSESDLDGVARPGRRSPKTTGDRKQPPRPVVVRFTRKVKRDEFIKAAKMRRNLNSKDIDPNDSESKIYVNDRLTRENRQLFRDARTRAKQLDYKHCWTNGGIIFVRKREGSGPIQIRSHSDLDRYLADHSSIHRQEE